MLVDAPVNPPPQDQPLDLRQYLTILRIRKWTVIVVTAVVFFAVMAYSLRMTPMYTSTAKVLVKPLTANAEVFGTQPGNSIVMDTERELVTSTSVALVAAPSLSGDIPADVLAGSVTTSVPPNTQVLDISA